MLGGGVMGISIKTNFASNAEIATMFGTIDTMQRYKVGDRVVTAGSTPILKRAKELAKALHNPENSNKRSAKQKAEANWDMPLWQTVTKKVVRVERGAYAIIGPRWPEGNKAYFNTSPNGRTVVYWGKYQGAVKLAIRNWIVQAADETRGEQLDAMKAKMQEAMDEVMRG